MCGQTRPISPDPAPPQHSVLPAVAVGGALGTVARYGISRLFDVSPEGFPWATFWINTSGSFVLGLILALLLARYPPSQYLRAFAATGFLGAYTTASTFAVETVVLVKDGHPAVALTYVAASLSAGLLAAWAGMLVARMRPGPA